MDTHQVNTALRPVPCTLLHCSSATGLAVVQVTGQPRPLTVAAALVTPLTTAPSTVPHAALIRDTLTVLQQTPPVVQVQAVLLPLRPTVAPPELQFALRLAGAHRWFALHFAAHTVTLWELGYWPSDDRELTTWSLTTVASPAALVPPALALAARLAAPMVIA